MISVGIIGNGRMAKAVASQLQNSDFNIEFIAARSWKDRADFSTDIPKIIIGNDKIPTVDIMLFCVSDSSISILSQHISGSKLNIHFSGSRALSELHNSIPKGVIWPVQSITASGGDWKNVPIVWEAESDTNEYTKKLVEALKPASCINLPYEQRLELHIAAVFISNFTNSMLVAVDELLNSDPLKIEVLLPLLHHTISRYSGGNAFINQTGPAIRNDEGTIERHLSSLHNKPELSSLYKSITRYIQIKGEENA